MAHIRGSNSNSYLREVRPASHIPMLWKSHLYELQQQAPTPKRIVCSREIYNRPAHYGREFHGRISREEADRLLSECDGCYLVRESQRAPCQYTLSLRFGNVTKNFRLYHDRKHYVGEKRFDTIQDLVADGLISLYLESHAGDYIAMMCQQAKYEESPYMTLNAYKRKLQKFQSTHGLKSSRSSSLKKVNEFEVVYEKPASENGDEESHYGTSEINVLAFEKAHTFKTHNFKGLSWCEICGNFMWGIIAQGVKCEDCGLSCHHRCSETLPNDCLPDRKFVKRMFGVDLTTLVKARNTVRPVVVDKCIKEIERRGMESEGIYRVSGFSDEVENVRMRFDRDGEFAEIGPKACEDIHVIAGVLKLFFRLLPLPLITYDSYTYFMSAIKKTTVEERLEGLREAVAQLPPAHLQTLKSLMAHLYRIAEKQKYNLMSPHNLSTVFCPTLMVSPDSGPVMDQLAKWQQESAIVEMLIVYHKSIFES